MAKAPDRLQNLMETAFGEAGMGAEAHLPWVWRALLRYAARSDRLSELRGGVRSAGTGPRRARAAAASQAKAKAAAAKPVDDAAETVDAEDDELEIDDAAIDLDDDDDDDIIPDDDDDDAIADPDVSEVLDKAKDDDTDRDS